MLLLILIPTYNSTQEEKDPLNHLLQNVTINRDQCESKCTKQGDGRFYCKWTNGQGVKTVMECLNPITIAYVKAKTDQIKKTLLGKIKMWEQRIQEQITTFEGLKGVYTDIKAKHDILQGKLDTLNTVKNFMVSNIKDAYSFKKVYEDLSKKITNLKAAIWNYKAKLKEQEESGTKTDCAGMIGYQSPFEGDGINAYIYPTEVFHGNPTLQVEQNIDFVWADEAPAKRINKNNFSVRYSGFIKVPKTGRYKFTLNSDDGAFMSLNGDEIIRDRISDEPVSDWLKPYLEAMEESIRMGEYEEFLNPKTELKLKNSSLEIELEEGLFYEFEVRYVHTVHNTIDEEPMSWVHLLWESDSLPQQVVPRFYLYTQIKMPTVGISHFDESSFIMDIVEENGVAFLDSKYWRSVDIPVEVSGAMRLRSFAMFDKPGVRFTSDQPIKVYIAYDWNDPSPLPAEFMETDLEMSLLKIDDKGFKELMNYGFTDAIDQVNMAFWVKDYTEGDISIKVNIPKGDFTYMQILIVPDPMAKKYNCGGAIQELSIWSDDPKKREVAMCESSSFLEHGYECQYGLSNSFEDKKGSMFKTDNEGVGAYMNIYFKEIVKPTMLVIAQPSNPAEQNKKIRVKYSDAMYEDLVLAQREGAQVVPLTNPFPTKVIKVEVLEVYGTINNGFSVLFKGMKCKDEDEVKKVEDVKFERLADEKLVLLKCSSNLTNTIGIDKQLNAKTKVFCAEGCQFKEKHKFYGDSSAYSGDSSICRTAFYETLIGPAGGEFELTYLEGKNSYNAGAQKTKECSPENKEGTFPSSFKVVAMVDPETQAKLEYKESDEVDVKHEKKCWIRGTVSSIEKQADKSIVKVTAAGDSISFKFPSKEFSLNLGKCGTKFKGAECKTKHSLVKNPAASMKKQELECNSFRNGDCASSPLDCVFEDYELKETKVECNGDMTFIRIDYESKCKLLNCMNKCIKNTYPSKGECDATCPYDCEKETKDYVCKKKDY